MTEQYIPFADIIHEIRRIFNQQESGTLFITSDSNYSAQLMFNAGQITFANCFNKRGMAALEVLKKTHAGRYRFQKGKSFSKTIPLPATDKILQILDKTQGLNTHTVPEESTNTGSADSNTAIDDIILKELHRAVIEVTGPAGELLIDDAMQKLHFKASMIPVNRFTELVAEIIEGIPGSKQKTVFKKLMSRYIDA